MVQWRKGWGPQGGSPFLGSDLVGGWAAALSWLSLAAVSKHSPQLPPSGTVPLKPLHALPHPLAGLCNLTGGTGSSPFPAGALNISQDA